MKKIVGIIVVILMIPVIISVIGDIDRTPVYPITEFSITKDNQISILDLPTQNELFKLPNDVGDRWLNNGIIERKVSEEFIFDGSENWILGTLMGETNIRRFYTTSKMVASQNINNHPIITNSETFKYYDEAYNVLREKVVYGLNNLFFYIYVDTVERLNLPPDSDSITLINAFKSWLGDNNLKVRHQLETPVIETSVELPSYINFYSDGEVVLDDGIVNYTVDGDIAYINYIEGNITEVLNEQFVVSKPSKIISKKDDIIDYDINTLPPYFEYGTLPTGTYDNTLEFINNNQNKQIKIYFDGNIQETRYNIYLENDTIIIDNDIEVIRIYNDDTYTSTRNLDTNITYKLEGYNIIGYIDGEFDNTVLVFFWIIPVLLAGGLIYLLIKRKE